MAKKKKSKARRVVHAVFHPVETAIRGVRAAPGAMRAGASLTGRGLRATARAVRHPAVAAHNARIDLGNAMQNTATRLGTAWQNTVDRLGNSAPVNFVQDSFWRTRGTDVAGKLFTIDLDNGHFNAITIRRMQALINQGATFNFETSLDDEDAKAAVAALGLQIPSTSTSTQMYIAYNNGANVMASKDGTFEADRVDIAVTPPARDASGHVVFDPVTGAPMLGVPTPVTPLSTDQKNRLVMLQASDEYRNGTVRINVDEDNNTITITNGPMIGRRRQETVQLAMARRLIDLLGAYPDEMDVLSDDYTLNFTPDGMVIGPKDKNYVNAEWSVRSAAGIKGEEARRQVGHIGQINEPLTIGEVRQLFADPNDPTHILTVEEVRALRGDVMGDIVDRLYRPDNEFDSADTNTNNGTYFARHGIGNGTQLRQVYNHVQANRITNHDDFAQLANGLRDTLDDGVFPIYDSKYMGPHIVSYERYTQAISASPRTPADDATIKSFNEQFDAYGRGRTDALVTFLTDLPGMYARPPHGRVSSMFLNLMGRNHLPPVYPTGYNGQEYYEYATSTIQNLTDYSAQIRALSTKDERVNAAADFDVFQEELFEFQTEGLKKINEETNERTKQQMTADLHLQMFDKINEFMLTHALAAGSTPPHPTPPHPTPPEDAEDLFIQKTALEQNIKANEAVLTNIVILHGGNVDEAKKDPSYQAIEEMNMVLTAQQTKFNADHPVVAEPADKKYVKELREGMFYSAMGNGVMMANDIIASHAAATGTTPRLIKEITPKDSVVYSMPYMQAMMASYDGVDAVDIMAYASDVELHDSILGYNNAMQAAIKGKIHDPALVQDTNYAIVADIVHQDIDIKNKYIEKALEKTDKHDDDIKITSTYMRNPMFNRLVTKPPVDQYKRIRVFMEPTLEVTSDYLKSMGLEGSLEFQIFEEMRHVVQNSELGKGFTQRTRKGNSLKAIKNANIRDRELGPINTGWKQIEKKYKDNPEALAKAQNLFALAAAQSENAYYRYRSTYSKYKISSIPYDERYAFLTSDDMRKNMDDTLRRAVAGAENNPEANKYIQTVLDESKRIDANYKAARSKGKVVHMAAGKKASKSKTHTAEDEEVYEADETMAAGKVEEKAAAKKTTKKPETKKEKTATETKKKTTKPKTSKPKTKKEPVKVVEKEEHNEAYVQWASMSAAGTSKDLQGAMLRDSTKTEAEIRGSKLFKALDKEGDVARKNLSESVVNNGHLTSGIPAGDKHAADVADAIDAVNVAAYNTIAKATGVTAPLEDRQIPDSMKSTVVKALTTKDESKLTPEEKAVRDALTPMTQAAVEVKREQKREEAEQKVVEEQAAFDAVHGDMNADSTGYTADKVKLWKAQKQAQKVNNMSNQEIAEEVVGPAMGK